jgi:hypothetical protein
MNRFQGASELNRDEKQVSAKRTGGMRGETRKKSVDGRSDQAKKTGNVARRSRLVREKGSVPPG